jgi:hypothetical protein
MITRVSTSLRTSGSLRQHARATRRVTSIRLFATTRNGVDGSHSMPHAIVREHGHTIVTDVVVVDGVIGLVPLAARALAVVVGGEATRDGLAIVGGLAVLHAGEGATIRSAAGRVDVRWVAGSAATAARTAQRCRLCFGAIPAGAPLVACDCDAPFHLDCDRARLDCPGCGAPRSTPEAA